MSARHSENIQVLGQRKKKTRKKTKPRKRTKNDE